MNKKRKAEGVSRDEPSQKLKHERQRQAYIDNMHNFWQKQLDKIKNTDFKNLKQHDLPLARIKKIMRSDEDVKMISAEAPVLFAKACELFILDLTMRAWSHADAHRRRTLQREDVATAVADSEMFDFLLDVIPRVPPPDQTHPPAKKKGSPDATSIADMISASDNAEKDQSDGRLRRPMLNPLQTPLLSFMPVPVDNSKPTEPPLAVVDVKGPASRVMKKTNDPIFNQGVPRSDSLINSEGFLMLSGPSTETSHANSNLAAGNLSMNLRLTDPTKPPAAGDQPTPTTTF